MWKVRDCCFFDCLIAVMKFWNFFIFSLKFNLFKRNFLFKFYENLIWYVTHGAGGEESKFLKISLFFFCKMKYVWPLFYYIIKEFKFFKNFKNYDYFAQKCAYHKFLPKQPPIFSKHINLKLNFFFFFKIDNIVALLSENLFCLCVYNVIEMGLWPLWR